MRQRSWTAIFVLAAGLSVLFGLPVRAQQPGTDQGHAKVESADLPKARGETQTPNKTAQGSSAHSVELNLLIAGLGRDGCEVEIRPGNRGSRFKPQTDHVGPSGKGTFVFRDVEVLGADRYCSFAVTMREPGQTTKTIFRAFRIAMRAAPNGSPTGAQTFTCYMNSPSKLAGLDRTDRTRR